MRATSAVIVLTVPVAHPGRAGHEREVPTQPTSSSSQTEGGTALPSAWAR